MVLAVYALCVATSLTCAALLIRAYRRSPVPLVLYTALCFVGLAANNVLLLVDSLIGPNIDLEIWRKLPAIAGVVLLLYGCVFESR